MRRKGLFLATLAVSTLLLAACQKEEAKKDVVIPEVVTTENAGGNDTAQNVTDGKTENVTEEVKNPENAPANPEQNPENTPAGDDKEQNTDTDKKPAVTAPSGTPYETHGKLSVNGTQLVDKDGEPFQLHGVSTHGLSWFPDYVNSDSFRCLRDDMKANGIRLAMYTAEYNGYCTGDEKNKENLYNLVCKGIDAATDLGMYVIADWHILSDNNPKNNQKEAEKFFDKLSKKYADYDNVLYELCNEPNGGTSWKDIKEYAEVLIPIIRANDPDAIIIVGTPTWSQDVDKAAADPIKGYDNIMYTVHFYADSHKDDLRRKMTKAISAGLPVICTEFGICDASGNGRNNLSEGTKWIETMNDNGVSYFSWNLSNKNESSSLISSSVSKTKGWDYNEFSESGKWLYDTYNKMADPNYKVPDSNTKVGSVVDGSNQTITTTPSTPKLPGDVTSTGEVKATASATNSWDGHIQYSLSIQNGKNSAISGWKIVITFSKNIDSVDLWCANKEVNGKTLTLTPVDYNNTIEAGSSFNDIGFIIGADDGFQITSIEVK